MIFIILFSLDLNNPFLRCKVLYYASEQDMLKALRYALLREVTRSGGYLHGSNLTALYTFVDALAQVIIDRQILLLQNPELLRNRGAPT
jgi:hypothetical protein